MQTSTQTTGASYTFNYLYNKLGGLKQETYPSQSSQRQIANVFDAAGRITSVTGTVGGNVTTYATGVVYDPTGPMVTLPLNNGVTETWTLGTPQKQPTALVAAKNGSPLLTLGWSYGPDASNNGNVMGATIANVGVTGTLSQAYTYDMVNRLSTSSETLPGSPGWTRNHLYDAFGNACVSLNTNLPLNSNTPAPFPATVANCQAYFGYYNPSWIVDNRLRINNASYDASGNQSTIAGFVNTYDAENRLTSSTIGGATTGYFYDADGHRVKKVGSAGTTIYVYDAAGQLATENSSAPPPPPCGTCYLTADHLGSTRMVTDASGNVVSLHDYLPFGEEIQSGTDTRSGLYVNDTINQKFTGKERDVETGLDYFGARYLSSTQGRFTSPDEFKGEIIDVFSGQNIDTDAVLTYADIGDPQTLNKYMYVRNNPLRYIDPDGHGLWDTIRDAAADLVNGASRGAAASISMGTAPGAGPKSSDSTTNLIGQTIGAGITAIVGSKIAEGGAALTIDSGGTAAIAGVAGIAAGVTLQVGATKDLGAIMNTAMQMSLAKPASGKGSVAPDQRDPKRTLTTKEKTEQLAEQKGNCAHCEKPVTGEKGIAHHDPVRHADGGTEMKVVHKACHDSLHSCN